MMDKRAKADMKTYAASIKQLINEKVQARSWRDSYKRIKPPGVKFDNGKLQWNLLPLEQVEEVVRVLTKGAKKYAPDNWKYVEGPRSRYYDAAMRHLSSWVKGHKKDKQTGCSHLAHAVCCLIFLMWFDRKDRR